MLMIFLFWLVRATDFLAGTFWRIPTLRKRFLEETAIPKISVLFAARNEAAKVGETVSRLLAQDYPDYEVIAVDDRSDDGTGEILASFRDPRLRVVRIEKLPEGWLGKTHALYQGLRTSSGEWLLFTDADVVMDPATLASAVAAIRENKLDHLTLFPKLLLHHYVETLFTAYFMLAFNLRYRPWAASSPRSLAYVGVGAFNMVRRTAYEKIGTHEVLALDVADDMILGRFVKRAGFRQQAMFGHELISVRWVEGWRGVLNGLHKNAFRGLNYSFLNLIGATFALAAVDLLPFLLLFVSRGPVFYFSAATVGMIFLVYLSGQKYNKRSLSAFFGHPVSCLFFLFVLWRSALTALRDGGVYWRETFYSLKELRRGMK